MDELINLKKFEGAAAACNRCGFCTSYCPTYNATGNEVHSPRGRVQMFRAIIEGKITSADQAKESIDTCLLCGECTSVCFSEVPTAFLMMQARHYLNQRVGVPPFLAFFLTHVLPYPKRLGRILRFSFFAKKLGISKLLRKMGVLQRFAPALASANALVSKVPLMFLLDYKSGRAHKERVMLEASQAQARAAQKTPRLAVPSSWQRPKIAYMPACGSQYIRPQIGLATFALLKKMNVDFVVPELVCCGLPAASYGVSERVRFLAQENITRLERGHFESLLLDDSSCATHLKELPKFFQEDPEWIKRAHDLSQKVRDLPTYFLQRGLKDHLKLTSWAGGPVAFHNPCKAQYGQRLTHPPRELMMAIPNFKLVPIADADQCCGGAGTYSFVQPEMSQAVLAAKVNNIAASGCKMVVTSSASCLIQLAFGLREKHPDIHALHLTEFLLRALEKRK